MKALSSFFVVLLALGCSSPVGVDSIVSDLGNLAQAQCEHPGGRYTCSAFNPDPQSCGDLQPAEWDCGVEPGLADCQAIDYDKTHDGIYTLIYEPEDNYYHGGLRVGDCSWEMLRVPKK